MALADPLARDADSGYQLGSCARFRVLATPVQVPTQRSDTSGPSVLQFPTSTPKPRYPRQFKRLGDVFDYIECFYNPVRRHATLGYVSPIRYEEQAQAALSCVHETGCSSGRHTRSPANPITSVATRRPTPTSP